MDGGNVKPEMTVTHKCQVPTDRTGYYIILGVWEIGDTGNAFYQAIDANLTQTPSPDTEAPKQPTGLAASNVTESALTLSWAAAVDNIGVTKYEVYRDGKLVSTTAARTFADSGLNAATAYVYTVTALDAANNRSTSSAALTVTTKSTTVTPPSGTAPVWDSSKIYLAGDKVTFDGTQYVAGWWTKGESPAFSDVWKAVSTSAVPTWNDLKAYNGGYKVVYAGHTYKAKWWTKGEIPGKAEVWTLIE